MYASVETFTSQPGKLDEFLAEFRDRIVPVIKESAIQHEYILTDTKTNKVIAIALFETEAEALKACKALTYFVGPVEVGRELPQQPCAWAGAYWPMIEEQAD